jgi:isopenicillin-N epimerase
VKSGKAALNFASLWGLDPSVIYLNHGSYGACPTAVLEAQAALRRDMEREPVDFLSTHYQRRLDAARTALAAFLGAAPEELAFVTNATAGVNAVLRSLAFEPEDELLVTTHTYAACQNTVDFVAQSARARVVIAEPPFPCTGEAEIIAAVMERVSSRTRLALIDHITSPTAMILPVAKLILELEARGVDALVDGAHAPGMVPVELSKLGAAYYTGNAHKWLCAPKGAAFLYVRRDRQQGLHPNVISHGYSSGFHAEFDWTGTFDPTPWLCIAESIRYMGSVLAGGWPELMAHNCALARRGRTLVLEALETPAPCPESMIGSMFSLPLPLAKGRTSGERLDCDGLHSWFRERNLEAWFHPYPRPLLRLSAQLYNTFEQFEQYVRLLREALQ